MISANATQAQTVIPQPQDLRLGLFKRRPWVREDIPDLTFREEESRIDIGYLPGEEHRQAFADIFERMLSDNRQALADYSIVALQSKRPVRLSQAGIELPIALAQVGQPTRALALALYDSNNEDVDLQLAGPLGRSDLRVRFDNPEFWFRSAAV
jgi:hypothetical protein